MEFNNTLQRIQFHFRSQNPSVILDIGAHVGTYSNVFRSVYPDAMIYAIEPDMESFNILKNGNYTAINELLSDVSGKTLTFYSKKGCATGASYKKEIYGNHYKQDVIETQMTSISLDDLVEKYHIPKIDLIKIDTQGSELEILAGARETLKKYNPKIIAMECNIVEYNSNSPLIDEQIKFMRSIGYHPLDLTETHYVRDRLLQIDFLFMNDQYKQVLDTISSQ